MKSTYRVKTYHSAARPKLKALVAWEDESGKRQRKFFVSIAEAKTYAQQRETELLNQGREVLSFPSWLRIMAQECQGRLARHGKNLREATDYFLTHIKEASASKSMEDAFAEYLRTKTDRGLSRDYHNHLNSLFKRFISTIPGRLVSAVTTENCLAWLRERPVSNFSRNHEIKTLSAFFSWCMSRKYCAENPAAQIEYFKEIETPVGILQPDELKKLLTAADPKMLAYVAIGAFAGLRVAELNRLDWSEVDFEDGFIEVTASKSKTAQRRLVKMQPCLRAWIQPIAKPHGKIVNGVKHGATWWNCATVRA